ncbi:hypothetical protein BDV34DRAFT_185090 [Aspergillus parasiticus]|uniref:Uncharacterized protein n=1 Tax=Aspergillus parasiticus TaxID=5067 RepID=A0A5N6E2E6_ASPPA|nr:hypothetical protein BDV34DRAFT_185090 [Aspergillus parasiticus]
MPVLLRRERVYICPPIRKISMSTAEEILPPSHRRKQPPLGVVLIHRARRLKLRSLSRSHFSAFLPVWPGSSIFLRPTCAIRLGGAG